ncbi:hypothetical protein [Halalkalibacter hemicellulosilyticus]|uniref:YceG-like family protein n=1 Tax=Halalkalibacter hemicellulosilyticusJCM 9152 TaxID=1236971 RepID=W4QGE2_9BACI|nr:hypothetical protein [Halalkalibacter hemicellulosilyticus]GAE30723.1 hypothetical protein JCM9152_2139 [Halalkalibacter hemicellulosilyticusJCM 9152]
MAAKGLQQFAGGLFLATALIGGALYFSHSQEEVIDAEEEDREAPLTSHEELSTAQLIEQLEQEQYVVISENEYAELSAAQLEEQEEGNEENVHERQTTYVMILEISQGMTSYDVAEQLVRGRIINNEQDLLSYVQSEQLSHRLRTGQYEVTSDMTIEEIVELMT